MLESRGGHKSQSQPYPDPMRESSKDSTSNQQATKNEGEQQN